MGSKKVNLGWEKANSNNLPTVDIFMITEFLKKEDRFNVPEMRGVKANCNTRESYGDNAIGYAQIRRDNYICSMKARICPEHKINESGYRVILDVDEKADIIINVNCEDCPAAKGGCKHALAFLMWVHRRSEEPSPTDIACYWKKPALASTGASKKFLMLSDLHDMNREKHTSLPDCDNFLNKVLTFGQRRHVDSQLSRHNYEVNELMQLSIFRLAIKHGDTNCPIPFEEFVTGEMREDLCKMAEVETRKQALSSLWQELRYGRVTASKLHEVSHCQTLDGSLVTQVLGAIKLKPNFAMKRGINLESKVIEVVGKNLSKRIKPSGLLLHRDYPIFGASPDGITDDFVMEVKCPVSEKGIKKYIDNGVLKNRYKAQIQLQMLMAGKEQGLFCVAHPDFEVSKKVDTLWVHLDKTYLGNETGNAKKFWKRGILPKVFLSCQHN
ncbi:uncharacterized protein LOC124170180 [Ischnura elegans]|uniref:uncharacterized protein LOC124170180 n=1 Tax=Ischnura elegans TaxID=197161 RepID=UPI001ED86C0E|nr:uncharacterized protein LOC124170180 [Ischnura elegans]